MRTLYDHILASIETLSGFVVRPTTAGTTAGGRKQQRCMATEAVQRLLDQYVGKYIVGLEENQLRFALWRGEVRVTRGGVAREAQTTTPNLTRAPRTA